MILVGLGQAGNNIVKLFKPHTKNYKIIFLDENNGIEKRDSVEEYDEHKIVFKQRGLKSHSKAALFVCGSGKIAGASLRVLEALAGWETTVFYIVPDLEFASREEKRRHRAHFGILQEYARSGKVKEMVILSNEKIISIVGYGTALNYYEKVNFFMYNTIQKIMYCRHVDPDFGSIKEKREISRISTIGLGKLKEEERLLFPLSNITESMFLMNIEEEDLNGDIEIIPRCQQIVRKAKLEERDASFAIWKSSEDNHFYSLHYTHFIQEIK
jgi:hypothetical protein